MKERHRQEIRKRDKEEKGQKQVTQKRKTNRVGGIQEKKNIIRKER